MKKILLYLLLSVSAVGLMSNSGCNGIFPVINPNDTSQSSYACIDAYGDYIEGAKYHGVIKTKITDTIYYATILHHSANGDKYWVIPTPNIKSVSPSHPLYGLADRVITYDSANTRFIVDMLTCCTWYYIPQDDTRNQIASIFYDCKSTSRFVTHFKMR